MKNYILTLITIFLIALYACKKLEIEDSTSETQIIDLKSDEINEHISKTFDLIEENYLFNGFIGNLYISTDGTQIFVPLKKLANQDASKHIVKIICRNNFFIYHTDYGDLPRCLGSGDECANVTVDGKTGIYLCNSSGGGTLIY